MKKTYLLILVLILLLPSVLAKQGHMKLLSVRDTPSGDIGSKADLYLEIRPGTGRVFLDTYPLTKLDTQISTRFAKEIACNYIDFNCEKYDFIYTIKAEAPIVGGASAGAAITSLTITVLEDYEINENISITGTINSGGLIGPVGGLKAKLEAAADSGIIKVLIPKGDRFIPVQNISDIFKELAINTTNETLDLVEYGNKLGVEVIEVSSLDEVLYHFTGKRINEIEGELSVNEDYIATMSFLSKKLCERSAKLKEALSTYELPDDLIDDKKEAYNLTDKGKVSEKEKDYYSAASYCFGANAKLHYLILSAQNLSEDKLLEKIEKNKESLDNFTQAVKKIEIKTITDLEAYAVVKERLIEAEDYLKKSENINNTESLNNLAYGIERLYSAYSWSYFFGKPGKEFTFDKESVKKSCIEKISESEERYQYITNVIPLIFIDRKELDLAYEDLENEDYELCLFKASKAKASIDVILSLFGAEEDDLKDIIKQKLAFVEKTIIKEINKGIFPIIGYSYYEYANSLKEDDEYAALLYSEYALELSNLDLYFKRVDDKKFEFSIYYYIISAYILGLIIGFILAKLYPKIIKQKSRKKPIKKRIKKKK